METPAANTLVSDHIIKALCNTLMHSLWQGILLAIITGAIIIFTKKASAAYRYNLLVGALTLFAGGVLFTFMFQLQQLQPGQAAIAYQVNVPATMPIAHQVNILAIAPVAAQIATSIAHQSPKESITETVVSYFNNHYNIIVLIWFLIICAKSVQMAVGLHGVYYLKRTKVFAVGEDWESRLLQLAKQLRIKQTIRLMESGIAKVPMVIGHLKPVILIPIGLINSLTPDAVEAILVHELAHIRRRDYLVNLLQSFMEIVFFFNPAVLWLSQLIKAERENCCDDMALAQSSNKENYIRALVSCEEYRAAGRAYAMAFPGGKHSLLARVKRMIGNRNHSLNVFEKTMLAVCLVVFGLGVSAFTAREPIEKVIRKVVAAIHHDKVPVKEKAKVAATDTTEKKQLEQDHLNNLLNQLKQNQHDTIKTTGDARLDALVHHIDSLSGNNNLQLALNAQRSGLNGNQVLLNNNFNSSLSLLAKQDTNILKTLKQSQDIGRELYREHLLTDTNHLNISTNLDKRELIVNGVRMPEDVYQRIYTKFYKKGGNDGYSSNYGSGRSGAYGYDASRDRDDREKSQQIGDEFVRDNLVKYKSHFTFKLSKDGLDIDGVKQPDELYRRIVDEYFKPGDDFNITYIYRDPGINGASNSRYNKSSADHQRQGEEQQRKIIDEMARDGLINDRADLSFTLTDKTFVINGLVQNGEVFQKYRQEYVPADAGDNWTWNYSSPESYPTNAYRGRDWDVYSRQTAAEGQRVEAERDKKLVADLLQDDLITDPNNVTFSLSDKGLKINGKKQSDDIYKKYKEKYQPDNTGTGWSWTYSHHE